LEEVIVTVGAVAVAARGGDTAGRVDAGAVDPAGGDRLAEGEVEVVARATIADGGEAGEEGFLA